MSLRGPSELGSTCYCVATLAENFRPIIDGHIIPTRFRLFKAFVGGRLMLDKKSYVASRGFIASLVRSRLVCRPRSIALTLCGWMSTPVAQMAARRQPSARERDQAHVRLREREVCCSGSVLSYWRRNRRTRTRTPGTGRFPQPLA